MIVNVCIIIIIINSQEEIIQLCADDSNYTVKWRSCKAGLRCGMQAVVGLEKHLWLLLTWLTEQRLNQGCQSFKAKSASYSHMNQKSPTFVDRGCSRSHSAWRCTVAEWNTVTCSPMGYVLPSDLPLALQIPFA